MSRGEHGKDEGERHRARLGGNERPALRQAVGDEPAEQPENQHRPELRRRDEPEGERIAG